MDNDYLQEFIKGFVNTLVVMLPFTIWTIFIILALKQENYAAVIVTIIAMFLYGSLIIQEKLQNKIIKEYKALIELKNNIIEEHLKLNKEMLTRIKFLEEDITGPNYVLEKFIPTNEIISDEYWYYKVKING